MIRFRSRLVLTAIAVLPNPVGAACTRSKCQEEQAKEAFAAPDLCHRAIKPLLAGVNRSGRSTKAWTLSCGTQQMCNQSEGILQYAWNVLPFPRM